MVNPLLRSEQAGFRRGRSCADHIVTLRQIMEQSNEWNATLYANFIDFAKVFDSIHRPAMWKDHGSLRNTRQEYIHHQDALPGLPGQSDMWAPTSRTASHYRLCLLSPLTG